MRTSGRVAGMGVLMTLALGTGACTKLAVLDTVIPHDSGAERVAEDVAYGPEPRQRLDIYAPEDLQRPAPVVIFVYGGGWDSGRRAGYQFVGHAFASRGFVTVIPDYRLVPSVRYPVFVKDTARAVAWVQDHVQRFGGRPADIGLAGHSAGAYNAIMLAVSPRFRTAPDGTRLDIAAVAGLAGPYDFLPLDSAKTRAAFGSADELGATQPVNLVQETGPALFLATGQADRTVAPANSDALAHAARKAGRRVTVKRYPDVGHAGLLLSLGRWFRHRAPVLADTVRFFDRHLRAATARR